MKIIRKITLLLFIVLISISILAACQPKQTPNGDAQIYVNMIVKCDKSQMSKIGITNSEADKILKEDKDSNIEDIKNVFQTGQAAVSDAQILNMYNALMDDFKKATVTTSVVSQDDKSAKVKIKTTYFDIKKLFQKASTDATTQIRSKGLTDEDEATKEYWDAYAANIVQQLKIAKPSTSTREKTFNFTFKDNAWVPEDKTTFSTDLGNLILGQ
jgi:hypothetical protein